MDHEYFVKCPIHDTKYPLGSGCPDCNAIDEKGIPFKQFVHFDYIVLDKDGETKILNLKNALEALGLKVVLYEYERLRSLTVQIPVKVKETDLHINITDNQHVIEALK